MGRQSKEKPQGKLIIRKKRINAKGEVPIYVSYFIKGKTIERSTDMFIPPTLWDAKGQIIVGHKDAPRLNNKLAAIKRGHDEAIEQYDGLMTAEILRKLLDGEAVEGRPNPKKTDFIQYALDYNQRRYDIQKIGYSTFYNAKLYLFKFKKFIEIKRGEPNIPIAEMTIAIIDEYKEYRLKEIGKETLNKELTPIIKGISYAEQNGLVDASAFGNLNDIYIGKSRSYGEGVEEMEEDIHYLTKEQMDAFIAYYPKAKYKRTREIMDMFLFAFHACGLRVSDIATLEWKHIDFVNKRMEKRLVKGKNFHEIHLNQYAIAILNKWKALNRNPRFVFDLLPVDFKFEANGDREAADKRLKNAITSKNRTIQTSLNEIGIKIGLDFGLSMHVARHTFAIWALNERDISLHLVSRMLGHKSIEATEKNYAKFLKDKVDEVIEKKATFDGCLPDL